MQADLPRPPPKRPFRGKHERTRISVKHQVTIPRDAYVPAGFKVGGKLHATCLGPGRVVLERIEPEHEELRLLEGAA